MSLRCLCAVSWQLSGASGALLGDCPILAGAFARPEDPSPEVVDEGPDETFWVWSPDADFWSPDLPSGPEPPNPIEKPIDNADLTETSAHNTDEVVESNTEPQYVPLAAIVFF